MLEVFPSCSHFERKIGIIIKMIWGNRARNSVAGCCVVDSGLVSAFPSFRNLF
jgi:hypothetical protein